MRLVYLTAPPALIAERLAGRHGHFMPASLLASQFAALEPPDPDENALTVVMDAPVETVVERIAAVANRPLICRRAALSTECGVEIGGAMANS